MDKIGAFVGEYRWLSNFFPCQIKYVGQIFQSVEAAYQAQKCYYNTDKKRFEDIGASAAKKLIKEVEKITWWKDNRIMVMRDLIHIKFMDPILREKLLATGDATIEEGNLWDDTYWGICRGKGENNLGKIIMQERKRIREE